MSPVYRCLNPSFQGCEATLKGSTGTGEIEADVVAISELMASGKADSVAFEMGDRIIETELRDVQPCQIGRFDRGCLHPG